MKVETEIRRHVLDALRRVPDASRIGVAVDREIVTLAGTVASLDARTNAEKIASSVEGVSAVNNELQIETVSWGHSVIGHVLVTVDLSDEHLGALRYARLFADKLRSRLTVLRPPVTRGLPAPAVLECVSKFGSDLLVIGARQTDAGGTGTTTEEIVQSASTPVLIVPLHA